MHLPAGTTVAMREKLLDMQITDALNDAAQRIGVVLDTGAHGFAQLTGQVDGAKRSEFVIQGRVEGDRLVPVRLHRRRRW